MTSSGVDRRLVLISDAGRLGNRLLAFAHAIAFAIEHEYSVSSPTFARYAHHFPAIAHESNGFLWPRSLQDRLTFWADRHVHRAHWSTVIVPAGSSEAVPLEQVVPTREPKRNVVLSGWLFRDSATLKKHAAAVRRIFAPQDDISVEVEKIMGRLKAPVVVGMHVRRGDYRHYRDGEYCYSDDVYLRVMERARELFAPAEVQFVICSDEAVTLRVMLRRPSAVGGPGGEVSDLYALSRCDYIIGPPSTYSMWAAFYGDRPLLHLQPSQTSVTLSDFIPVEMLLEDGYV